MGQPLGTTFQVEGAAGERLLRWRMDLVCLSNSEKGSLCRAL